MTDKKTEEKALVKPETFTFGSIELEIIKNEKDPLTPTSSLEIFLPTDDKTAIALGVKENMPVLLIGETGVGKTSAVKQLAHLRQQPYIRVNMTGFTVPDDLIGTKSVRATKHGNETYYEHGIITNAMQRGAILVIDEINATTPDCLFILHGLLDEDRQITLPNGDVIHPHPNFRVFATCNPDYEGTKSMNKAFLDRFPIIITVDTLPADEEKELLQKRTGINENLANILVASAIMARKDYLDQKIFSYVSTRSLLYVGKLVSHGMTPKEAWITTIAKKTSNKDEQKALLDFFLANAKQAENPEDDNAPVITTKKKMKDLKEQIQLGERKIMDTERKLAEMEVIKKKMEADAILFLEQTELIKKEVEKQQGLIETEQKKNKDLETKVETYKAIEQIIKSTAEQISQTDNEKSGQIPSKAEEPNKKEIPF